MYTKPLRYKVTPLSDGFHSIYSFFHAPGPQINRSFHTLSLDWCIPGIMHNTIRWGWCKMTGMYQCRDIVFRGRFIKGTGGLRKFVRWHIVSSPHLINLSPFSSSMYGRHRLSASIFDARTKRFLSLEYLLFIIYNSSYEMTLKGQSNEITLTIFI